MCAHNQLQSKVLDELEMIVYNGNKYVYDDVDNFIRESKSKGYRVNILTYGDRKFQLKKLSNLDICDMIDNIIIASDYKFNLDLNYNNSIFIDDNPRDLEGLCNRSAGRVIRISRNETKYATVALNNKNIENYDGLNKISISDFSVKRSLLK